MIFWKVWAILLSVLVVSWLVWCQGWVGGFHLSSPLMLFGMIWTIWCHIFSDQEPSYGRLEMSRLMPGLPRLTLLLAGGGVLNWAQKVSIQSIPGIRISFARLSFINQLIFGAAMNIFQCTSQSAPEPDFPSKGKLFYQKYSSCGIRFLLFCPNGN